MLGRLNKTTKIALCFILMFSLALSLCGCDSARQEEAVINSEQQPEAPDKSTAAPDISEKLPQAESPEPVTFTFTKQNMPVLDGSTATIPLGEAVMSVLLGLPRGECEVEFFGTSNAYNRLINGNSDVLLVYEPTDETVNFINSFDDKVEMAAIGRDGLVFLVNAANPLAGITTDEIRGIYMGEITNWSELGGDDIPIKAYRRNSTAGSQALMEKLVMKGDEMADLGSDMIVGSMGGLIETVGGYDNSEGAIGYNVYYYVTEMRLEDNVKLLEIDGVAPSIESISSGDYPFINDFYVVIRSSEPEDSPARILFNWIQGEEGQALVSHEGYAATGGVDD